PSDEKIRGWIEQLAAPYESDRQEARKALEAAGERAEKPLVEGLDHTDHRVRKGCLELLTGVGTAAGVPKACDMFRSKTEDRTVRNAAFEYLKRNAAKAEDLFIEALDHPEETFRMGAVEALTAMKSAKCLDKAAALFDREQVKAIKDRIFALLQAAGEPARPHLFKFLANADVGVRHEALRALNAMNTPAEDLVEPVAKLLKLEVTQGILDEAFGVYGRAGAKAEPYLIEGLRSPSELVRAKALDAVIAARTARALDAVADLFQREPVDTLRKSALEYLVDQGARAEAPLIRALDSPNPKVRTAAIPALGKIRSERVYDRLAELYRTDKNVEVRKACFEYLETVGIRAEAELIRALKDEDLDFRRRAIRALGLAQSEKAIGPLVDLLQDIKPEIQQATREALATIGPKAVEFLREGVAAKRVREKDANVVIGIHHQIVVEKILDGMITEEGSTGEISTGTYPGQFAELDRFGRERCLPVLWRIISDPEYTLRYRSSGPIPIRYTSYLQCLAILALGELGDAAMLKKLQGLSFPAGDGLHRELLVALYRLGDKPPLESFVALELKEGRSNLTGDDRLTGYDKLLNAALMQSRVGLKTEAFRTYGELVGAIEGAKDQAEFQKYAPALYNIACLHAGAGRKAEAVAALGRAVEAGFRDFDWITRDRDLDPIREEEGFKKLLAGYERPPKPTR
ncbi:MAG TPA: HEAT repeat domain-containing protein, partial [Planctomycetota bacterium]|nr:HEAT repeat domain-containing protein [Planctomycetota bacterium]